MPIANTIIRAGKATQPSCQRRQNGDGFDSQWERPRSVTLPYPPALNHLYATVHGRRVLSLKGRDYKRKAALIAWLAGIRPIKGDVIVKIDFYRPRRAGDLDNMQKCLLDSMTGHAWFDDSQIVELHCRRFDDKENPRAELTIEAVRGVFVKIKKGIET